MLDKLQKDKTYKTIINNTSQANLLAHISTSYPHLSHNTSSLIVKLEQLKKELKNDFDYKTFYSQYPLVKKAEKELRNYIKQQWNKLSGTNYNNIYALPSHYLNSNGTLKKEYIEHITKDKYNRIKVSNFPFIIEKGMYEAIAKAPKTFIKQKLFNYVSDTGKTLAIRNFYTATTKSNKVYLLYVDNIYSQHKTYLSSRVNLVVSGNMNIGVTPFSRLDSTLFMPKKYAHKHNIKTPYPAKVEQSLKDIGYHHNAIVKNSEYKFKDKVWSGEHLHIKNTEQDLLKSAMYTFSQVMQNMYIAYWPALTKLNAVPTNYYHYTVLNKEQRKNVKQLIEQEFVKHAGYRSSFMALNYMYNKFNLPHSHLDYLSNVDCVNVLDNYVINAHKNNKIKKMNAKTIETQLYKVHKNKLLSDIINSQKPNENIQQSYDEFLLNKEL